MFCFFTSLGGQCIYTFLTSNFLNFSRVLPHTRSSIMLNVLLYCACMLCSVHVYVFPFSLDRVFLDWMAGEWKGGKVTFRRLAVRIYIFNDHKRYRHMLH